MRHWERIRANNAIKHLNRGIRRPAQAVDTFSSGRSTLPPVTARLKYVADSERGTKRHLDASPPDEQS